jgi:RNA polymerase sigma-B factor
VETRRAEQGNDMAPLVVNTTPLRVRRGDEVAWFRRYRDTRDPAMRDALVERFLGLAMHLARRYPRGNEHEDVAQVAALALVKAIDRFDPDRGVAFTSYATPTILGEIKRYFRDCGWAVKVPRDLQELTVRVEKLTGELTGRLGRAPTVAQLAEALGTSEEEVLEALQSTTAHRPVALDVREADDEEPRGVIAGVDERGFQGVEDAATVDSLLAMLPDRDRTVVELRFRHELLQREIADIVGISQMQVSRILTHAIAALHELATDR